MFSASRPLTLSQHVMILKKAQYSKSKFHDNIIIEICKVTNSRPNTGVIQAGQADLAPYPHNYNVYKHSGDFSNVPYP